MQHGQICMSTDIVIAHESIAKQLTDKMAVLASSWPMTSAVSEAGAAKTETLVKDALARGASLVTSSLLTSNGTSLHLKPAQLHPTILTGVTPDMRLYHEESFGPTVSLLTFQTENEAISLANESTYGLSSSIFSRNIPKALNLARQIEAGAVHINSMSVHDEQQLPHGGMKASGWGRFGVPWGRSISAFFYHFFCTPERRYLANFVDR
jgi:acyl-CoA reductase-like NAD-dependent aldehyde dehydrogenase